MRGFESLARLCKVKWRPGSGEPNEPADVLPSWLSFPRMSPAGEIADRCAHPAELLSRLVLAWELCEAALFSVFVTKCHLGDLECKRLKSPPWKTVFIVALIPKIKQNGVNPKLTMKIAQ